MHIMLLGDSSWALGMWMVGACNLLSSTPVHMYHQGAVLICSLLYQNIASRFKLKLVSQKFPSQNLLSTEHKSPLAAIEM